MTVAEQKETLGFQTEVKQLLHLMIHSLYSNKEIFLRELISNASDAADKLRFEALEDANLYGDDPNLAIRITFDEEAKTVTISDNGIGMSKDEVIENLGTIAKSGTAEFLSQLTGDQQKDSQLIGQFGVGFYSSFIVADEVTVETRKAGLPADEGVRWHSKGEGEFDIESIDKADRGTRITLHLKSEDTEFADHFRLRSLVTKYSDHIALPVEMKEPVMDAGETDTEEGEEKAAPAEPTFAAVNEAKAMWTRPRSEIKDDEYKEFYRHVSHDFEEPLTWSHNQVEGNLEYTSLLYIPKRAPFDLWNRDVPRGLKLYVQRVFIMDNAEEFLPSYLRFVKGIVDSASLSLNVSREILQQNPQVEKLRSALSKRALDMLEKMAKKEPEQYLEFWKELGVVLKEGPAEDLGNKEKIAKLFRFASTHDDKAEQTHSIEDYIGRMQEGQTKIYYSLGDSFNTAKNSPQLEVFRKKSVEVLLLSDNIDDWMITQLQEFDGKEFQDVAKGELDLGDVEAEEDKKKQEETAKELEGLIERITKVLEEQVDTVRVTHRLTDSPACLVVGQFDMSPQMQRIMEAAGQKMPESKPAFEINPEHPLVLKLDQEPDEDRFQELTLVLFEQAKLAQGSQLDDPASYVQRLNKLLLDLTG